eukprot:182169_1
MDGISELIQAHVSISILEKEIRNCRDNLIKQHTTQNTTTNLNIYISKVSYNKYAQQLKQETAKFEKILQDLDVKDTIKNGEIMDNIESDTASTQSQIINAYSVSIKSNNDIQVIKREEQKKKKDTKKPMKKKKIISKPNAYDSKKVNKKVNKNINKKVNKNVVLRNNVRSQNTMKRKTAPIIVNNNNNNNIKPVKPMMVINNIECVKVNKPKTNNTKISKRYNRNKINSRRIKGFEVYKNKPIYSSTLLFCKETCGKNKNQLKNYLIKWGNFNEINIEQILFRTNYVLIRVRGPLNIIQQKMDILNNKKGNMFGDVIEFHTALQYNDNNKPQKVLYVNNFDIINGKKK